MKVSEIMSREVLTVTPETTVAAAAQLMVRNRVSGLPVVENGRMVGIFSEGDLLHRAETGTEKHHRSRFMEFLLGTGLAADEYIISHSRRVGDLMTTEVAFVTESSELQDAVDLMEKFRVRRVPVLRDGVLVGVISRLDLVRVLADKLEQATDAGASDIDIERKVKAEIDAMPLLSATNVDVTVKGHVVTLSGVIFNERVRQALIVAARNAAPTAAVDDQLVVTDLTTGMVVA